MTRWREFAEQVPVLAQIGIRRLTGPGVVLVATIRRDGSPRVSPVEPLLWDGDLWLSMALGSRKATDLRRDARILVHSIVTSRNGEDGEYKLRGVAVEDSRAATQAGYAQEVAARLGWQPEPGKFHLFRIELTDITFIRWGDETNDQYVTMWKTNDPYVTILPAGTDGQVMRLPRGAAGAERRRAANELSHSCPGALRGDGYPARGLSRRATGELAAGRFPRGRGAARHPGRRHRPDDDHADSRR